jgi:pimeloyl-ACP methyl ester carboxylesterase
MMQWFVSGTLHATIETWLRIAAREERGVTTKRNGLLLTALGIPLGAALGWIGYSNAAIPHSMPLPPALSGERREFAGARAGPLSYYAAGEGGPPLLLIHSVNAAASAYEVRPLFEHYRRERRVYALDLPGFGFSDRSERAYTPRLMADAIHDMLDEIAREGHGEPLDALALSLSAEFLARAASESPERFRTLALVSPTGFGKGEQYYGEPGSVRGTRIAQQLFSFPLWSRPFFDLLNSRPSAKYFLAKTFGSYERIDQGLLEYDYLTAHQPGAQNAPYYFISGMLFSADIDRVYESAEPPVWLAYGLHGEFSEFSDTANVEARGWLIQSFDTGALPYFERPATFIEAYDIFLERALAAR